MGQQEQGRLHLLITFPIFLKSIRNCIWHIRIPVSYTHLHIEQIIRKTKARYTVAKLPYRRYVEERLHKFEIQKQRALSDRIDFE